MVDLVLNRNVIAELFIEHGVNQHAPKEQSGFPWYNFSEVVPPGVLSEWQKKLEKLKTGDFYIANAVSWEWLQQVGLVDAMNSYLTKKKLWLVG
uniref:Uncharacterized protein n=1 Tax=Lactuca sativa TaxID=4236 RepID=A0A9R1UGJ6_LACSA|nr:hypothetical protein LSAT_V11C900477030 [Lactuca sativa]